MRLLGLGIGALITAAAGISFAAPALRLSFEGSLMTPAGLYGIAAFRIAIGMVFILAGRASRAPRIIQALGVLVIIAGLATPWFGVARARAVLNAAASASSLWLRLDAGIGIALGLLLVYTFRGRGRGRRTI
jgi:uncharacterized protein YjeT (DUF2065 family)